MISEWCTQGWDFKNKWAISKLFTFNKIRVLSFLISYMKIKFEKSCRGTFCSHCLPLVCLESAVAPSKGVGLMWSALAGYFFFACHIAKLPLWYCQAPSDWKDPKTVRRHLCPDKLCVDELVWPIKINKPNCMYLQSLQLHVRDRKVCSQACSGVRWIMSLTGGPVMTIAWPGEGKADPLSQQRWCWSWATRCPLGIPGPSPEVAPRASLSLKHLHLWGWGMPSDCHGSWMKLWIILKWAERIFSCQKLSEEFLQWMSFLLEMAWNYLLCQFSLSLFLFCSVHSIFIKTVVCRHKGISAIVRMAWRDCVGTSLKWSLPAGIWHVDWPWDSQVSP